MDHELKINGRVHHINTNTYISVGLLVSFMFGIWLILNSIYTTKFELTSNEQHVLDKLESVSARMDSFSTRMDKLEKTQETWGLQDMFKWAIHLQRENQGKIIVPEPEAKTQ